MTVRVVARLPDALVASVDALIADGAFASRSEAVRAGLEAVVDPERRSATGRAIVAGYRRRPQEGDDLGAPGAATAAMIAEEPW